MVLSRGGASRTCPFCGERIKAVAIRCRYCHADLEPVSADSPEPPGSAASTRAVAPEDEDRSTTAAKDDPPRRSPAATTQRREGAGEDAGSPDADATPHDPRRTIALAVAAGLAAVLVAVLGWRAATGSDPSTIGGPTLDEAARTQVLISAADRAQRTLSYTYDTLDQDVEDAQAKMTKEFRGEYDDTMAQVRDNTIKNKISLQATVVAAAIVSATEHEAKVLVFTNQTATAEGKDDPQLNRSSLIVTLTRGGGDWLLSDLEAVR